MLQFVGCCVWPLVLVGRGCENAVTAVGGLISIIRQHPAEGASPVETRNLLMLMFILI